MAPGNGDLIRPIYEEWGRGNWRPRFDVYHPHMEWGWSDEFPGLAGVYDDRRDPNPRLRTWLSAWEDWRVEVDDYSSSAITWSCSRPTTVEGRAAGWRSTSREPSLRVARGQGRASRDIRGSGEGDRVRSRRGRRSAAALAKFYRARPGALLHVARSSIS
jgi:hypothetical protein